LLLFALYLYARVQS